MFAYCKNGPVEKCDNQGTGPWDLFKTIEEAAEDFGRTYNAASIKSKQEYGSGIYSILKPQLSVYSFSLFGIKFYRTELTFQRYYYYTPANIGNHGDSVLPNLAPSLLGKIPVSTVHTHANYDPKYDNEHFSDDDKWWSIFFRMDTYLVTPGGTLKKYYYRIDDEKVISYDMSKDPNSPVIPIEAEGQK